jgi:hypothetical protein
MSGIEPELVAPKANMLPLTSHPVLKRKLGIKSFIYEIYNSERTEQSKKNK